MKTQVKIMCKCTGPSAKFQDERYGKDVRVATVSQKGTDKVRQVTCTVCGTKQNKDCS